MQRFICLCLMSCLSIKGYSQTTIGDLVVEYLETPIGIDESKPRFSWKMFADGDHRGVSQTAYQIIVVDENSREVWKGDKIASDKSLNIIYEGEPLQPETRYNWTVSVWDQDGRSTEQSSWFETGLMNPNPNLQAWDGAKWIGGGSDDLVLNAHALSVFKVSYDVRLDENSGSTKAGFVLGANDRRLMDKNLNILGVENGLNESYIIIELDISGVEQDEGLAKLNVYRVGYTPKDGVDDPLYSFDIPNNLINEGNKYNWHEVYFEMNFGKCLIFINGREKENVINEESEVPPWVDVRGVSLNPLGDAGGDLIVYPVLADIGFSMQKGQQASFKDLKVTNFRAPSNALFSEKIRGEQDYIGIFDQAPESVLTVEEGVYQVGNPNQPVLTVADPSKNAMPMLRSEFTLDQKVKKARLYVTARGIYEMYLNGRRVGEEYFNPGLTQYNKTHMYQIYDVTKLVNEGKNAIGAMLGEGWWSGNITYRGFNWNYFGDRQSLLTKLVITYEDDSTETITSSPNTWKYFNDGPIRYSSFFQGEIYVSRKENLVDGWSTAEFDDVAWSNAVEVPLNEETTYFDESFNYDSLRIISQIGINASVVKTLQAKEVEEVRPGVFVYDMGQNMVGFPQIALQGDEGDTITMRYAEMLYPNLPEYEPYVGMIMMENIRGAHTTDKWILKGGEETIKPRFTFHGYRFLEITGIDSPLPLEAVKGLVVSSIDELASSYETSNELVNKLWENITWSFRGNFLSIPTDTPARNERMGWNGDINVFAKTATFLGDVDPFLRRHLIANRELQEEDGRFPDIAPIGTGFGGTLWGSAGIIIPWELYQQYGDKRVLEEHYEAMKAYVDFLVSKQDPETGILDEGPLGDWLSPEGYKNDNSLLWTAYQVRDLEILYKTAELLGKSEDAKVYRDQHEERKNFFNATYVDPKTGKTIHSGYSGISLAAKPEGWQSPRKGDFIDTQASYAVVLALGVFNDQYKEQAAEHLANAVRRKNPDHTSVMRPEVSLMTGFIGTASLAPALSEHGYDELAYQLLQQTSYPSWLYSVVNGATTIWERLNSYTIEEGFGGNNSMNSFNHYSFGAIGAWMYNQSLGIKRDKPGFKSFILEPTPDPTGQMTWAKGHYDSMYGRIESEWKLEGDEFICQITVPANTTATLLLPTNDPKNVLESGKKVSKAKGVKFVKMESGRAVYKLSAGSYRFNYPDR